MGNRLTFWSKGPAIGLGNGADAMSNHIELERLKAEADAAWAAREAAWEAAWEAARAAEGEK